MSAARNNSASDPPYLVDPRVRIGHVHLKVADLQRALRSISARVLLVPGETDLYFRVADNAAELPYLAHAELKPIPSIWGHRAGNPATNPADARFVKDAVRDWLAR